MKELEIQATIANIPTVTTFVDDQLEAVDCPQKALMQINIAIDELFSNIARYAYDPEVGPAKVLVEVTEIPLCVVITFIDHGVPYDPLSQPAPDLSDWDNEESEGGFGIFLVKQTMDAVEYRYESGKNILKIKKNL